MREIITAKDGTKIILREIRMSDAKDLTKYINQVVAEPNHDVSLWMKQTVKREKEWIKGVLKKIKTKEEILLVVESNGKARGTIDIDRKPLWTLGAHIATLGIILAKELRNKGIAQKAISFIINLAKKRMKGLEIIELDTYERNKIGQHVYTKLGFNKVALIPYRHKLKKGYQNDVIMQKYLKNKF